LGTVFKVCENRAALQTEMNSLIKRVSSDNKNTLDNLFKSLRVRFFGKIRKRICDPRSDGFFDTKETQNPKKDYFVMTRDRLEARNIYVRMIFLSYCPRIQLEWNTNNL